MVQVAPEPLTVEMLRDLVLGVFQNPSDQNELTTPHHIPKYEILQKKIFSKTIPLKSVIKICKLGRKTT